MTNPSRKPLRVAIQADPLSSLSPDYDSTLSMIRAALRRDYRVFYYQAADLRWRNDGEQAGLWTQGAWVQEWTESAPLPYLGLAESANLASFDVVLLRQSPPLDMSYITSTYLLEQISDQVLVVNAPRAVRDAPEKFLIAHYPDLLPPTLISSDAATIDAFRAQYGVTVLKPLYSAGSEGVVRIAPEAGSSVVTNYLTHQNGLPCIAQQFLPAVSSGDKMILLINGTIMGACRRVPKAGDFRASVANAGASIEPCSVTERDKMMINRFSRTLVERGIIFAAVDIIGDHIIEINVAAPNGFSVIDEYARLKGLNCCEEKFWDAVQQKLVLRKL